MSSTKFRDELENRTLEFSHKIFIYSTKLPSNSECNVIKNQLSKSASSIGANYREANRARSRADFRNKIKICESEANETFYWLQLCSKLRLGEDEERKKLLEKSKRFLALFSKIARSSR